MTTLNSHEDKRAQDMELVISNLANQLLSKATIADAFSAIPLDTMVQLVQKQAIEKAKKTINELPQEDVDQIVQQIKKNAETNSSDQ